MMKRKLMSLLLCLCMALSILPISAFAAIPTSENGLVAGILGAQDNEEPAQTAGIKVGTACTLTEGCTLNAGHEGECQACICKTKCGDSVDAQCPVCSKNIAGCIAAEQSEAEGNALTAALMSLQAEDSVVVNDGTYYATIEEAIQQAVSGDTLTLLKNVTITKPIIIDKNLIIDGGNHSITGGTASGNNRQGLFHMFNEADSPVSLTLKNIQLFNKSSWSSPCGVSIRASNQTLTLEKVTIDTSYYGIFVGVPGGEHEDVNDVAVHISDSEITGYAAVYYRTNSTTNMIMRPVLEANNSQLFGRGYNGNGNGFSTIVYNGTRNAKATIDHCTLSNSYYSENQDADEGVIQFNGYGAFEKGAQVTISNSTIQTSNTSSAPNVIKYVCTQNLNQDNKVMIDENTLITDKSGKKLIRVMRNGNELVATGIELKAVLEIEVYDDTTWDTEVQYYPLLQGGETVFIPNGYEIDAGNTQKDQAIIHITKDLTIDGENNTLTVSGNNANLCNLIGIDLGAKVTIKNLILAGDGKVQHGIYAGGNSKLTLTGVTIKNFKSTGLAVDGSTVTATDLTTFGNSGGGVSVGKGQAATANPVFTLVSGDLLETLKIWAENADASTPLESYVVAPTGWAVTKTGNRLVWDKAEAPSDAADKVDQIVTEVTQAENVLDSPTATAVEKEKAKETINTSVEEAAAAVAGVKDQLTVAERKEIADTVNTLEESFVKANQEVLAVVPAAPTVNNLVPEAQKIPSKPVEVQGLAVSALAGKTISADTQVFLRVEQQVPSAEQTGKIVLSIQPQLQVDTNPAATIPNSDLQTPVTFKVYLNDRFAGSYAEVVHLFEGGGSERFVLPVQLDANGKFIVMTVSEFSDFIVTPSFGLDISKGGSGVSGGGSYTEGETVSINAGSRSNYRFSYWSSSNGGTFANANSANTTFTMPANEVTLTAHWTYTGNDGEDSSYDYYDIKITKEGNGTVSPNGAGNSVSVRERRDQTFTFTPDKGYVVSDVLVDGKSIGAKASYTFKDLTEDHTLKVIFKASGNHANPQTGVKTCCAD